MRVDDPRTECVRAPFATPDVPLSPRPSRVVRSCASCGFTGTYGTAASADYHHGRHSCAKHAAAKRRRQGRRTPGLRRECAHHGGLHRHGSRVAYVRDRCRCGPCRAANAAATASARKNRTLGEPLDLVDAEVTRSRLRRLRQGGLGIHRISALSGVAPSHIRELLRIRPDGQPAVSRVRRATADRVAEIPPLAAPSPSAQVRALGTIRRLQALHAIGWSTPTLAALLGRTPRNLRLTMARERVTVATDRAVAELFEDLWDRRPDTADLLAEATRAEALMRGWVPPLGWDDIDSDETPPVVPNDPGDIDEIAVERALARDGVALRDLNPQEQAVVIGALTDRGRSIADIADALTTTTRTVSRRRAALKAAS